MQSNAFLFMIVSMKEEDIISPLKKIYSRTLHKAYKVIICAVTTFL